jgi:hypothetical protein
MQHSEYRDSLHPGGSGDRILLEGTVLQPSVPVQEPTQAPVKWVPVLFLLEKSGRGVALTNHSYMIYDIYIYI